MSRNTGGKPQSARRRNMFSRSEHEKLPVDDATFSKSVVLLRNPMGGLVFFACGFQLLRAYQRDRKKMEESLTQEGLLRIYLESIKSAEDSDSSCPLQTYIESAKTADDDGPTTSER